MVVFIALENKTVVNWPQPWLSRFPGRQAASPPYSHSQPLIKASILSVITDHPSLLVQFHGRQEEQSADDKLVKSHVSFLPFICLLCKWLMVMVVMKAMIGISLSLYRWWVFCILISCKHSYLYKKGVIPICHFHDGAIPFRHISCCGCGPYP